MNRMIVTVFTTEEDAYEGLDALGELDRKGDIVVYATAVIVKDITGNVHVRQAAPKGPVGMAVGMLTGGLVGLLAGPAGALGAATAAGMSTGGMTGLLFDMGSAGVNVDFLEEVSEVLLPGTAAIVAEIEEEWVTPVDTKMNEFGGIVLRRSRSDVIEDQLTAESETFHEEMEKIQEEIKAGNAKTKAAVNRTLTSAENHLKTIKQKSEEKIDQVTKETKAKVTAIQSRLKNANNAQKATIEKKIAEIKAGGKARSEKLRKARELAHEALLPQG